MTDRKFAVGDLVTVNESATGPMVGRVLQVAKLPRGEYGVNYTLTSPNGGPSAKAPEHLLRAATPAEVKSVQTAPQAFVLGEVVKFQPGPKRPTGYFVVIYRRRKEDCYDIAPLGGHACQFYKNVPQSLLISVAVAEAEKTLRD